jgi:hypothetical protein
MAAAGPSKRDFETRLRELMSSLDRERDNDGCVQCVGCRACQSSTFCRDSERLVRCHYCVRSSMCTDCSHCSGSRGLLACQHCVDCEGCSSSSYLVRCVAVSRASYCFGCVGISNKDFHILNEPYPRAAYFEITRRLSAELGIGR